ncbi:MAG: mechanosensitive ion channel domain-containing protein [Akkermansiaceae bacterium]
MTFLIKKISLISYLCFGLCLVVGNLALAQEGGLTDEKVKVEEVTADQRISQRLKQIYVALDGLENIEIKTVSGVVILSGKVLDAESSETAVSLAQKTEGVIYVRSDLEVDTEITNRINPLKKKLASWWGSLSSKFPLIMVAIGVVFVAYMIGRWIASLNYVYNAIGLEGMPALLVKRLIRIIITLIGIALALEILDATTMVGAVLGLAGVAGIAIGFAVQGIVENYLAGMLLSARNPFELGDLVEVGSRKGTVVRLTSRDTVLMTPEGNHLRVPNGKILKEDIMNYSRNPKRRFDFGVGVSVELDLVRVKDLGLDILSKINGVLDDPGPSVVIEELGDSSVKMRFYGWMNQTESDLQKVRSESIRLIKSKFDREGIEMPEPIYRVINLNKEPAERAANEQEYLDSAIESEELQATDTAKDSDIDDAVRKEISNVEEENLLKKSEL